jgi:hypothetical protein
MWIFRSVGQAISRRNKTRSRRKSVGVRFRNRHDAETNGTAAAFEEFTAQR